MSHVFVILAINSSSLFLKGLWRNKKEGIILTVIFTLSLAGSATDTSHTMQGDAMSNRRIHVQHSFCEFARALNKFWSVESWFLDTWSSGSSYIAQWKANKQWLFTVLCICCHWTMYPKNQLSTNQNLLDAHANSRNDRWLDTMYHSVGHVSPCIVCIYSLSMVNPKNEKGLEWINIL